MPAQFVEVIDCADKTDTSYEMHNSGDAVMYLYYSNVPSLT